MRPRWEIDRRYVLRDLSELERKGHVPDAALAHYEQAVALLRRLDDPLKLAHTIRHLGDIHVENRQWPEAERCLAEAILLHALWIWQTKCEPTLRKDRDGPARRSPRALDRGLQIV